MIPKMELRNYVINGIAHDLENKEEGFDEARVKYILSVYTHLTINENATDEQQVAWSVLNYKKESGINCQIGNISIDWKRAVMDAPSVANDIVKMQQNTSLEMEKFRNCDFLIKLLVRLIRNVTFEFSKAQFYAIDFLSSGPLEGISEEKLRKQVCARGKIEESVCNKELKKLLEIKAIELNDDKYVLSDVIILKCYI